MLTAAAGLVLVAGVAPSAQATTGTGAQGGYVATPSTVRSAQVELRVPKVNCAHATKPGTLRLGLFGVSSGQAWNLAVIASCHSGRARYRAAFSDDIGQPPVVAHRGDLIRLEIKPGPEYEIDNVTTGEGEGGARGGSGAPPTIGRVVLGARVQGAFPAGTHTVLRGGRINGQPLAAVAHQRQAQHRGGAKLVVAGRLNPAGTAFAIATK